MHNFLKQPVVPFGCKTERKHKKLQQEMKNEWRLVTKVTPAMNFQLQLVQESCNSGSGV